jgi:hypothetical protein
MFIQSFRWSCLCFFLLFHFAATSYTFSQEGMKSIPHAIVAEAKRRLIPLSAIQLRGNQWVACVHSERHGESCITLGNKLTRSSSLDQSKGSEGVRYHREAHRLVRTTDIELIRTYMYQHPEEPYLVVVTVPSLCEPCRRLDVVLRNYHTDKPGENGKMKTFILEYSSFGEAEAAALGKGAIFPTSIVFPAESELAKSQLPKLAYGISSQIDLQATSKTISDTFYRRPSSVARGALDQASLIAIMQTAEKGRESNVLKP